MRLLFAGTPPAAVPSLDALARSAHEVVAVLTRPDAPAGRGRAATGSAVKDRAIQLGLEVLTPSRPTDPEFLSRLTRLAPDLAPIVAYGGLIPPAALDIPRHGWVNLHFSLLPAWRGAAPVQRAVIAGDDITGATTFRLDHGLDTGPVYGVMTERITATDTAGALLQRLAVGGADLLVATVDGIASGAVEAAPQPAEGVSFAPKLTVDEARVGWDEPAARVDRLIRGCTPSPGAWTTFRGQRLKLGPVAPVESTSGAGRTDVVRPLAPGEIAAEKTAVHVGTGSGPVLLGSVQPQGRTAMTAASWARGARVGPADRLGP